MKKLLSVTLLIVLVLTLATTVKAATPAEELYNYISGTFTIAGQEVKLLTDDQLVTAERYLSTHELTNDEYLHVRDQIVSTVDIMDEAGVTSVYDLEDADLNKVKSNVKEAAETLGLTVNYDANKKTISVYDGTTLLETTSLDNANKAVQTDVVNYAYVAAPIVAIIAVAMFVGYKKVVNA